MNQASNVSKTFDSEFDFKKITFVSFISSKMKNIRFVVFLTVITSVQQLNFAQQNTFDVQMRLVKGSDAHIGSYSYPLELKNETGFKMPVDSARCKTGYFVINPLLAVFENRNSSDSARKVFENILSYIQMDTLQFVTNALITNRIYFCSWIDGDIKKVVVDTDCDSSFRNEEILTYNLSNGLYDFGDSNLVFSDCDLTLRYDSLNIHKQKTIPIRVCLNENIDGKLMFDYDSLEVCISINACQEGRFIFEGDTVDIVMNPNCFDQFYPQNSIYGVYSYRYLGYDYLNYITNDEIRLFNKLFVIEKYDYFTRVLKVRFAGSDSVGAYQGNIFPVTPGLEKFDYYSLVFFTGSWCGPCKHLLPGLKELHKNNPEFEIFNVNNERDSIDYFKYLSQYGIDWPVIYDQDLANVDSYYWQSYNINSIPTLFLINPNRKILDVQTGLHNCLQLLKNLKENGIEYYETTGP